MKVLTLVGTRPELIRLSRTIAALDQTFEHVLVHTGQNYDYELNEVFFKDLKIRKPDVFLDSARDTAAATIAAVIEKLDAVLEAQKPDAFLVLGDTNSALGVISAKRRKIPIFHMEAGNRSFDQRVPEENNRKVVDHLSDINLCYSEIAREYLLREGLAPDRTIVTGSPMREVLAYYEKDWRASDVLNRLGLKPDQYFVLSVHREENVDQESRLRALVATLEAMNKAYPAKKVVFSIHPRTRKRIDQFGLKLPPNILESKPFGFLDYVSLMTQAHAVLSDSGTVTEEASILNLPALNLRDAHERPEGMLESTAILTSIHADEVLSGLKVLERQRKGEAKIHPVADYRADNVSEKVVRIIQSYTHYVNRFVWRKTL